MEFNVSIAMTQDQRTSTNQRSQAACGLCARLKVQMYSDTCAECVEGILLKYLPLLKQALEDKHGDLLDQWLSSGRFLEAQWTFDVDLYACREQLASFLRKLICGAISKGEIELKLLPGESWGPIHAPQFLNFVQERCEGHLLRLLGSVFNAIKEAPTEEAEREMIEIVSGKRRVNKRHIREEAISALVLTDGIRLPIKALIELRYRADGGRFPYAKVMDGQISSVWRVVEESLPAEVAKLICDDNPSNL
jgi:hypothetical protein